MADTLLAGDFAVADLITGAISDVLVDFLGSQNVATAQTTTSTSYADLATVGPTATVTSKGTRALVLWGLTQATTSGSCASSVAVSGSTTVAAADSHGTVGSDGGRTSIGWALFTITPGSNTYTLRYRVTGGTGTFLDRRMLVWAP
jgi:hypothetical protein